jgi:uncharacterized protein with PQ loop repeat
MIQFLLNILPTIAGILLGVCYIPQIMKTYKTKDVSSMSLSFWIILNCALLCLVVNAEVVFLTKGVWGLIATEVFNEGLALVMLIMVLKYRKKKAVVFEAPKQEFKGLPQIGFVSSGNTSGNTTDSTSGNAQ